MVLETTPAISFDRGVFTISLDFELIWGTRDLFGSTGFRRACEIERTTVIDRLLDLFVEFEIPATWCVLGHLFLERCSSGREGRPHAEIVRPRHSWHSGDWFDDDPVSSETEAPLFYGRSLVEKIQNCPVKQEIGCHSFSHVIFGDAGCSRETAESELAACVKAAKDLGIEMRSFAFPRNLVGHLDVLKEYGFLSYRGPEPQWYEKASFTPTQKRIGHLWDVLTAATPPVVVPEHTGGDLWNIPGSMIYFPMHGLRRYIPVSLRVSRARKGLDAAADKRRIFHLWFHPTNLADSTEAMFSGLRQILIYARSLCDEGRLAVRPMGEIASFLCNNAAAIS